MATTYCMVITTTVSPEEAEKLARLLVTDKLAACVQIMPISSYYTWQNALQKDAEYLLMIKSVSQNFHQIEAMIHENHSYEIPEIIQIPITQGSASYLNWLDKNTRPSTHP